MLIGLNAVSLSNGNVAVKAPPCSSLAPPLWTRHQIHRPLQTKTVLLVDVPFVEGWILVYLSLCRLFLHCTNPECFFKWMRLHVVSISGRILCHHCMLRINACIHVSAFILVKATLKKNEWRREWQALIHFNKYFNIFNWQCFAGLLFALIGFLWSSCLKHFTPWVVVSPDISFLNQVNWYY